VTVVPGYDETRTVAVRNGGATAATLTVAIVDAVTHQEPRDGFFDELLVNDLSAASLAGRTTVIHTQTLEPGASAQVPVRVSFRGTGGNGAVVGEKTFSFAVRLALTGLTVPPGAEPDTGLAGEATGPGGADAPGQVTPAAGTGAVSVTGGRRAASNPGLPLLTVALAGGAAFALMAASRRRAAAAPR